MTVKPKITPEVAEAEVKAWLDLKRVSEQRRTDKQDSIDAMVSGVTDGTLTIDPSTGTITQTLRMPLAGDDGGTKELKFKARLSAAQIRATLQGAKLTDSYGLVISIVAVLTDSPKTLIEKMDSEDISASQSIANFFL